MERTTPLLGRAVSLEVGAATWAIDLEAEVLQRALSRGQARRMHSEVEASVDPPFQCLSLSHFMRMLFSKPFNGATS